MRWLASGSNGAPAIYLSNAPAINRHVWVGLIVNRRGHRLVRQSPLSAAPVPRGKYMAINDNRAIEARAMSDRPWAVYVIGVLATVAAAYLLS